MTSGTSEGPRLRPLPPAEWPPEMRAALAALRPAEPRHPFPEPGGDRPKGLNVLGTLAHHPALTRAYHTFNGHVLFATTLSVRQRELLVLRVAAVRDAEYEWAQHVVLAGDAGIDDDEVTRVAAGPEAPGWSAFDARAAPAVDELVADAAISDATWAVAGRASSTTSSSWTSSSPWGPTTSWRWRSARSGWNWTPTCGENKLLASGD